MRVLAFTVTFLAMTACHQDIKKVSVADIISQEHVVTESVTTAPTERVTERWHYSITPGSRPAGIEDAKASHYPPPGFNPSGFNRSPGLGYALDEYERVTEKLEPVATTTVKADKSNETKTADSYDKDTDLGPGWKFYVVMALIFAAVLVIGYGSVKFNWLTVAKGLLKRVLG